MSKIPEVVGVDFETKAIGPRPLEYPPRPVGVAIVDPATRERVYLAWGHPPGLGNNCTAREAAGRLKDLYASRPVVYHNAAFDLEVGAAHLGLPAPREWHDTMLLAFLDDPRQGSLSLKPLAMKELGRPPREQDRLNAWLKAHGYRPGADISMGPVALVGPYAIGDDVRTIALFKVLYRRAVLDAGMGEAYDRERRLVPVLNDMQARGVPLDLPRLEREIPVWYARAKELEGYIVRRLGGRKAVGDDFNLGSGQQLADALENAELVTEFVLTAKGNRSTKRENLQQVLDDPKLFRALAERAVLLKYISTYGLKWLPRDEPIEGWNARPRPKGDGPWPGMSHDGRVFPRINQVHGYHDESRGGGGGARTGRLSYSDSWQAIPKPDRRLYDTLPVLRDFVLAPRGSAFQVRDYDQQEFRILAHYENGPLLARYQADPRIDMHETARQMIEELTGRRWERRPVKDTGFGLLYGMGIKKLARKAGVDEPTARELKAAYLKAVPGLAKLQAELKKRAQRGEPIRTWGGRVYYVEDPKVVDGELRTFDYKMLNVLIQGSAADCTKEAMIRAHAALGRDERLVLQVHDELMVETDASPAAQARAMRRLREAMESVTFDVAMLSAPSRGRRWGSLKKLKEPAGG